jgi:hypothetical protein
MIHMFIVLNLMALHMRRYTPYAASFETSDTLSSGGVMELVDEFIRKDT